MPACLIPHRSCPLHPRHIISQEQHGVCIINTLIFLVSPLYTYYSFYWVCFHFLCIWFSPKFLYPFAFVPPAPFV
ncbi:hypothetical protein BO79DRAFT_54658 [Aspergillus costaricaensis CBS 115574]|uniref:Uncharacterized protein n=1 Tax=Aspergillus costaricaensis CBS 115574 TaxID=1448317 RepID=A0ACD1IQG6_9EURO|nr:hypothetical protein BO79DRAFT_54658 [Aspergillus costaricaensis CBS 115574]RAK92625.1 hypothetical protein BO79DRAFT_54658 [Aspergillus costaricaensis CBS 115574]